MGTATPSIQTDLDLPQLPISSPVALPENLYEDLLKLYNAVWTLAQQIDTVLTLSEDVRFISATRGIILFDGANYWRVTINNIGVLITANIGPTLP